MERKELIQKRLELLLLIIIFIVLFIIIVNTPIINKYRNYGDLVISEIMANNQNIVLPNETISDYIEIYNGQDTAVDLSGYHLSDDALDTKKWTFPDNVVIDPFSYLLVYPDTKEKNEENLYLNFKLNKKGEVITLSKPNGEALSKITYLETLEDTSYGLVNDKYVYFYNPTPGLINDSEYEEKPITTNKSNLSLKITEYMTNNISNYKNKANTFDSVIEIYNSGLTDIDITNFYITNDSSNLKKFKFPKNTIIKSKSYLVLVASGLDKIIDNEVHTNFKLTNNDPSIILSDNHHNVIDKVIIQELESNLSYGLFEDKWHYYNYPSFGEDNQNNYLDNIDIKKEIIINEVSSQNPEAIEIKNLTNEVINLSNYQIGDSSGTIIKFPNIKLKANSYITIYGSDNYSYKNNKLYTGFHINNADEFLYLYQDNVIIQEFNVGKLPKEYSTGLDNDGNKVYYKDKTFNKSNSKNTYLGYTTTPTYSINGGYITEGTEISLSVPEDVTIYYTLDGSWPSNKSNKYQKPIKINKTTVLKTIAYKDNYLPSDITSRTYFVGTKHNLPVISISANQKSLDDLLVNYYKEQEKKISFEFYESNGSLGTSFIGGTKLTGMDSRKRDQKSMAIYLRKEYGNKEVTYPFFKDNDLLTYSSFTLRNSGEDPFGIRIQDTVLTYALKDQMDIDMQDYRAVVVYLNGTYYGLYNMREKLNGDYLKTNYDLESGEYDLIKYMTANEGSTKEYNKLINYIRTHNLKNKESYEYVANRVDLQALCNYLIVESYYGNTDQGNIRYWKSNNGKWRFMLYDLDWSLWNTNLSYNYPVLNTKSPAVTNLYSVYELARKLYKNNEFKELYLKTLSYHLENTFTKDRMNKIVDELAEEIRSEMPRHIKRWPNMHSNMNNWEKNVKNFKQKLTNRYNYVVKNIKSQFGLSEKEYQKYFSNL